MTLRQHKTNAITSYFLLVLTCVLGFSLSTPVFAATLGFLPASGTFQTTQTFSVSVQVSSAEQAINAVSGTISFDPKLVEVTALSRSRSIVSYWAVEPTYSNKNGTISFEGVIPNPGFKGSGGKLFTLSVKAKQAASPDLRFTAGSVLANDGAGTEVLSGMSKAQFTIKAETTDTKTTTSKAVSFFEAVVTSPTHPDQSKWYRDNNPQFSWQLPSGIVKLGVAVDQNPTTEPQANSAQLTSSFVDRDMQDGAWYLHVRFVAFDGISKVAHYHFQIDTHKPEMLAASIDAQAVRGGILKLSLQAKDALSGLDHYTVAIDNTSPQVIPADQDSFSTSGLVAGLHTVAIAAVDKAGNVSDPYTESVTIPLTHALADGGVNDVKSQPTESTDFTPWLIALALLAGIIIGGGIVWMYVCGVRYYKRPYIYLAHLVLELKARQRKLKKEIKSLEKKGLHHSLTAQEEKHLSLLRKRYVSWDHLVREIFKIRF